MIEQEYIEVLGRLILIKIFTVGEVSRRVDELIDYILEEGAIDIYRNKTRE